VEVLASVKAIYHRAPTCHLFITVDLPEQRLFVESETWSEELPYWCKPTREVRASRTGGSRVKCDDGPVASAVY